VPKFTKIGDGVAFPLIGEVVGLQVFAARMCSSARLLFIYLTENNKNSLWIYSVVTAKVKKGRKLHAANTSPVNAIELQYTV
jgi:hypothetical protein